MAVIGAGSWGTALAVHLARTGHLTVLWGVAPPSMADLARDRVNARYLPDAPFPASLTVAMSLEEALGAV
ncbi:MAG: NAD(P)H-dependent glycerol-3-phosphate dehydrogenase, partial [Steroidobacteraceae bacterium]